MQAEKLRHNEKQEKRSRQTRNEQILPFLPQAHPTQRKQVIKLNSNGRIVSSLIYSMVAMAILV